MGKTTSTITQNYHQELKYINEFKRALRRSDQLVLDDLLNHISKHLAAAGCACNLMPMEVFLVIILLEEHKEILRLKHQISSLESLLVEESIGEI